MLDAKTNEIGYVSGRLCALIEFLYESCKYKEGRTPNISLCSRSPYIMAENIGVTLRKFSEMPDYEVIMIEIMDKLTPEIGLPKQLNLAQQSNFYLGYYAQKGALPTYRHQIGNKIAELRTKKAMTQRDLAEASGVTQANINNIENGKYSVGIDVLAKIASALGWDFVNL